MKSRKQFKRYAQRVVTTAAEKKHYEWRWMSINPLSNGVLYGLPYPAQGAGEGERIGNDVIMDKVRLWMTIDLSTAAGAKNFLRCRMIVFEWGDVSTVPVIGDVLVSDPTIVILPITAPRNWERIQNVRIIKDKSWHFDKATTQSSKVLKMTLRKLSKRVQFKGSSSTQPTKNSIWMLFLTDAGTILDAPTWSLNGRFTYTDA